MKGVERVKERVVDATLSAVESSRQQVVPSRVTLVSHASTAALRRAAFPVKESLEAAGEERLGEEHLVEGEVERIAAIGWVVPRAQQVCCGPERRARETAAALGLQCSIETELADVDYGRWGGKEIDEIQSVDPEGLALWLTDVRAAPHGGESFVSVVARVETWLAGRMGAGHTVAVTHPVVIRAAICCALGMTAESIWRVEVGPLSVTDLRFNGRFWTVRTAGCSLDRC